jgi:hypothetical protein
MPAVSRFGDLQNAAVQFWASRQPKRSPPHSQGCLRVANLLQARE